MFIKNIIRWFYFTTTLGNKLIIAILKLNSIFFSYFVPDKVFIKKKFKKYLGYELDLDYPNSINEKIQWLKLNDRTAMHTICADKLLVRNYVRDKIGDSYLVPLLFVTDNVADLIPRNLPNEPLIIKTSHDSGKVVIVSSKDQADWGVIQQVIKKKLRHNFYRNNREWQYKNITPRIIVEKLILGKDNKIPRDYKLFCFNGKVKIIQVDLDRFTNHRRNLYDVNWQFLNCTLKFPNGHKVNKPKNMKKMIDIANSLSKEFIFSRVDLFSVSNKIYFGEITFHPGGGFEKFTPNEYDYKIGAYLDLFN